ncbi:hypothetical protein PMZ80_007602 [Knufia obscura]|uniref:Protein kinase domain-containing protein n=1 Tax=Knufia obscura TaxID=1635080 RepID=A0ABR0RHS6_9EURO|nr:hypothetical protein PMZ80_007602 [Knufia obscura]
MLVGGWWNAGWYGDHPKIESPITKQSRPTGVRGAIGGEAEQLRTSTRSPSKTSSSTINETPSPIPATPRLRGITSHAPTTTVNTSPRSRLDRSAPTQLVQGDVPTWDLSAIRDLPVPIKVPCKLVITVVGTGDKVEQHAHYRIFLIDWQKATSFERCVHAAERYLKQSGNGSNQFYMNFWQYRVLKQLRQDSSNTWAAHRSRAMHGKWPSRRQSEIEVFSESIEKKGGWREQLPRNLSRCLGNDRDATLGLELNLSYTRYSPHAVEDCKTQGCIASITKDLLERRVIPKSEKRVKLTKETWFIPGKFVNHYFTKSLIEHLVQHDTMLHSDSHWQSATPAQRKAFITHVLNFGTRLLASSILAKVDLRCLYYLSNGKTRKCDVDIPLDPRDINLVPEDIDSLTFEGFIRFQGSLKAHMFQDPLDGQFQPAAGLPMRAIRKHEIIDPGVVIPVVEKEILAHGGNAEVYKVRLQADHHKFSPDRGKWFALKRIVRSPIVTNPDHESIILEKLDKVPHDHLTPLLTSWSQGESCSILLPLAKESLHDLIRSQPWPTLDGSYVIWLLKQMTGLAAALDHIHNLGPADLGPTNEVRGMNGNRSNSGYHHDLHPKNILVFENDVLKISDFGTARLQQVIGSGSTNDFSHHTRRVLCHIDYEAPDHSRMKDAGRPHDVWALGCIYLEMLVWVSGKDGAVAEFYEERLWAEETAKQQAQDASFWYERNGQYQLKAVVRKKIANLKSQHKTFVFRTLIELVEGMLRIEIGRHAPKSRLPIDAVRSTLEKMVSQAELDLRENPRFFACPGTGKGVPTTYAPPSSIAGRPGNTPSELGAFDDSRMLDDGYLHVPSLRPARRHSTGDLEGLPRLSTTTAVMSTEADLHSDLAQTGDHLEDAPQPGTPTIVMSNHDQEARVSPSSPALHSHRSLNSLGLALEAVSPE